MSKAVVYYSLEGSSARYAELLSERLGARLIKLAPKKAYPKKGLLKYLVGGRAAAAGSKPELLPYRFEGGLYDTVVLVTPVWASHMTPPMRTFIAENLGALKEAKIGAVVLCKGGGPEKALADIKSALGRAELAAEAILIDPSFRPTDEENREKLGGFTDSLLD